jgi:hypothetical protein
MARRKQSDDDADSLPMTAAELDALQGDARREAELERARLMESAVEAAGRDQLPKLGGELPASETGPNIVPDQLPADPQQAAMDQAVAEIDWQAIDDQLRESEQAARDAFA